MKIGYRIILNVSPYSDDKEILCIKNKMLAHLLFDCATLEKLSPILSTFELDYDEND